MELSSPTLAIGLIRTLNQVQDERSGLGPEIDRLVQALHTAKEHHPAPPSVLTPSVLTPTVLTPNVLTPNVFTPTATAAADAATIADAAGTRAVATKRSRRRSFLRAARRPLVQATDLDGRR